MLTQFFLAFGQMIHIIIQRDKGCSRLFYHRLEAMQECSAVIPPRAAFLLFSFFPSSVHTSFFWVTRGLSPCGVMHPSPNGEQLVHPKAKKLRSMKLRVMCTHIDESGFCEMCSEVEINTA